LKVTLQNPLVRNKILEYHKTYGVNHIVFLMCNQFDADDVNQVLRERIAELEKGINEK
jgi:hypothetical protein